MVLHELRSSCFSLTECTEYLNNQGVPPPYCNDCKICDSDDNAEDCERPDDIESLFRRCQRWTESNCLQMISTLGRDIRKRRELAETHEFLASLADSIGYDDVTDATTETTALPEIDTSEVETWDNEEVAAHVLASLLDGECHLRDTQVGPDSNKRYDYDIRSHDGRVIALEVTQHVNSERRRQQKYIESELTPLYSSRHDWSVGVKGDARLEGLSNRLSQMLAKLDQLNIDSVYTGASHSLPPFMVRLRDLAIRSVIRTRRMTGPGCISVHAEPESGHTSHELVTSIAEDSLRRKAAKLRLAQADERHLWTWVDLEEFSMSSALSAAKFTRPSTLPDLTPSGVGEGIDVVWVAGSWIDESDGSSKTPIFKCDGDRWELVTLPKTVQQIITDSIHRSQPALTVDYAEPTGTVPHPENPDRHPARPGVARGQGMAALAPSGRARDRTRRPDERSR